MDQQHKNICQSCGMPLQKDEDLGTNADHSKNNEYCHYCYSKGKFTEDLTMDQMIEKIAGFHKLMNMTKEEANELAKKILPKLKRWKSK